VFGPVGRLQAGSIRLRRACPPTGVGGKTDRLEADRVARGRAAAFVLPVVLVLIGLLALTLAGFMFFVRSELAGAQAERDSEQARLAAESGLQEVIATLRTELPNPAAWHDAPDRFRHALVWSEGYDRQSDPVKQAGNRQEVLASKRITPAWRYCVVAPNLDGIQDTMRFGITPEAGKLNLNAASEGEIERLVTEVCIELQIENAPELVACLLDWLDDDDETRSGGAEADYYSTLSPAYRPKNGPLDSLEELLLIKGWSSAVLYGEDTNRNGILETNENDGDAAFPYYDKC
jgi:type II secretory pathway component PulK